MTVHTLTSSAGLEYTVSTDPEVIAAQADITVIVTITNPTPEPIPCERVALGPAPSRGLVLDHETVVPLVSDNWNVSTERNAYVFSAPGMSLEPGQQVTVRLERVRIPAPGETELALTLDGVESHGITLAAMPPGYHLGLLSLSASQVDRGQRVTLSWECAWDGANKTVVYDLYYSADGQETIPYTVDNGDTGAGGSVVVSGDGKSATITVHSEPLTGMATGFMLNAHFQDAAMTQTGVVSVSGGDVVAGTLEVDTATSMLGTPLKVVLPHTHNYFTAKTDGFLICAVEETNNQLRKVNVFVTPQAPMAHQRKYMIEAHRMGSAADPTRKNIFIPVEKDADVLIYSPSPDFRSATVIWHPLGAMADSFLYVNPEE